MTPRLRACANVTTAMSSIDEPSGRTTNEGVLAELYGPHPACSCASAGSNGWLGSGNRTALPDVLGPQGVSSSHDRIAAHSRRPDLALDHHAPSRVGAGLTQPRVQIRCPSHITTKGRR